jgi:hypothetical protein
MALELERKECCETTIKHPKTREQAMQALLLAFAERKGRWGALTPAGLLYRDCKMGARRELARRWGDDWGADPNAIDAHLAVAGVPAADELVAPDPEIG